MRRGTEDGLAFVGLLNQTAVFVVMKLIVINPSCPLQRWTRGLLISLAVTFEGA